MNKEESVKTLRLNLSGLGRSKHTVRAYGSDLEHYFDWIAENYGISDKSWSERATQSDVAQHYMYVMRKSDSASTLNRRICAIRYFAKMQDRPDPLAGYSAPKRSRGPAHPLAGGRDDLDTLVAEARTIEQKALVALCGMVGLRIEEARTVRVDDVKTITGQHYLSVRGKGDKTRTIPIPIRAWEIIFARIEELDRLSTCHSEVLVPSNPHLIEYSDRGARNVLTKMGQRAGIKVASHDLRMTFGTLVYNATTDIRATQALLGHANVETTVGYTGLADRAMISAVEGAFA